MNEVQQALEMTETSSFPAAIKAANELMVVTRVRRTPALARAEIAKTGSDQGCAKNTETDTYDTN